MLQGSNIKNMISLIIQKNTNRKSFGNQHFAKIKTWFQKHDIIEKILQKVKVNEILNKIEETFVNS